MKLYTSYFGNLKILEQDGIYPIAICCYPPKTFTGPNLIAIAPTPDILENCKSCHDLFRKRYKSEILSIFRDPQIFVDRVFAISEGKDVALCCFEKPGDFCHRHLIADWLKETLNMDVTEYKHEKISKANPLF